MSDIVEKLRVRRNPMLDGEREEAAAEIERLRGVIAARDAEIKALRDTIPPLIEDNERLRGLLREAIDADRDHYATAMAVLMAGCWHKRVREALGE